ncbi:P27 family phage terminase small subunit [Peptostreptococcus russellii]|uniref:P27 family phage terminase small subunit n=1 Tax=Peptostreptococcus russellii TaxID=215200 RepID=UPI003F58E1E2
MKSIDYIKKDTVKKMKKLNLYNKSFDKIIDVYSNLIFQYDKTLNKFIEEGEKYVVEHTNKNGSTNLSKNPLYLILEKQRTDIITYSRELGLSPVGFNKLSDELLDVKKSKLEKALSDL